MIPLKKRRSLLSAAFKQEEAKQAEAVQQRKETEAVEEDIMATQVANSLIHIANAASWLADSNSENQEPLPLSVAVEDAPTTMVDSAMAIIEYDKEASDEGEAAMAGELTEAPLVLHGGAAGIDGETSGKDEAALVAYGEKTEGRAELNVGAAVVLYDPSKRVTKRRSPRTQSTRRPNGEWNHRSLAIVERDQRRWLSVTRPRSGIARRPRADYAPFLSIVAFSAEQAGDIDIAAEIAAPLDVAEELPEPADVPAEIAAPPPLLLTEGDDENEDLYTRIKRRRGSRTRSVKVSAGTSSDQDSRCTRVNGRGWRCKEKAESGHTLCKQHLEEKLAKAKGNVGSTSAPKKKPGRKPKAGNTAAQPEKKPGRMKKSEEVEMPSTAAAPKKRGRKAKEEEKMPAGKTTKTVSIKGKEEETPALGKRTMTRSFEREVEEEPVVRMRRTRTLRSILRDAPFV